MPKENNHRKLKKKKIKKIEKKVAEVEDSPKQLSEQISIQEEEEKVP